MEREYSALELFTVRELNASHARGWSGAMPVSGDMTAIELGGFDVKCSYCGGVHHATYKGNQTYAGTVIHSRLYAHVQCPSTGRGYGVNRLDPTRIR